MSVENSRGLKYMGLLGTRSFQDLKTFAGHHKGLVIAWLLFSCAVAFCFQLGDLVTTSWQGYKMWECLFSGRIVEFYTFCEQLTDVCSALAYV